MRRLLHEIQSINQSMDFMLRVAHDSKETDNPVALYSTKTNMSAFRWDDPDQVHQRNRGIIAQSGILSSFDAP